MITKMEFESYPAIFKSADKGAIKTQVKYLNYLLTYNISIVLGVGFGLYGLHCHIMAIMAAILFLVGIFISAFLQYAQYEKIWYKCRAIAESVKTISWRYMMRANPFIQDHDLRTIDTIFLNRIRAILEEHKNLSEELTIDYGTTDQISLIMKEIRALDLKSRILFYKANRIDEQNSWYAKKANYNKKKSNLFFWILIGLHLIAIILVLFRIAFPSWEYLPSELFIVAASGVLTWIKVKKYKELAAAYGLAAHEISAIRNEMDFINNENEFSLFVINAENAFSREHSQWISRKDK